MALSGLHFERLLQRIQALLVLILIRNLAEASNGLARLLYQIEGHLLLG